jgi:hypothetical protein
MTCPNDDWRLIFSLCRFQGLRCPSEVVSLKWSDVQWGENGKDVLIIRACKTPERRIPIFPETRLLSAQEKAPSDQRYVIGGYRDSNSNLRTQFQRILTKAGIQSWPRLFHNLRASRETELMSHFPAHVVETWLGNTSKVAKDHYLQVTPDHIREATQKATHHPVATACNTLQARNESAVSPAFAKDTAVQIPPRGVEETRSHPRKSSPQQHSDPNSDPTTAAARTSVLDVHRLLPDGTSERVQQQVASLPAEVIAALWDMFRAQNRSPLQ